MQQDGGWKVCPMPILSYDDEWVIKYGLQYLSIPHCFPSLETLRLNNIGQRSEKGVQLFRNV